MPQVDMEVSEAMSRLQIVAAMCLLLFVVAASSVSCQSVSIKAPPQLDRVLYSSQVTSRDSISYFNATHLWDEIWNATSRDSLSTYTRRLSADYPQRIWNEGNKTPSPVLENAWAWANGTLMNNTAGQLVFHQVTDHKVLLAIKNGSGPAPRQAILVTGVISSGPTPGANQVASSVAAVLEIARVLQQYSLYCDIYYILVNRDAANLTTDLGARALVSWLDSSRIETVTSLSFERMLFDNGGFLYGTKISLRSHSDSSIYQDSGWIIDLLLRLSTTKGSGRLQYVTDQGIAQKSTAYELWQVGRLAVHLSQGYWYDTYHDTSNDVWDNSQYSYDKAKEVVACAACAIAYIASLGGGVASFYRISTLNPLAYVSEQIALTFNGFVNATVTWTGNTTISAAIKDGTSMQTVYQRTENDGLIVIKYLSKHSGPFELLVTNVGTNAILTTSSVMFLNDCDGDGLSDVFENSLGTSPYSTDTDRDGLSDSFELTYGTDPKNPDTDHDGALDYQEYLHGSNPLVPDSDSDGLLDGVEIALGTNPTNPDTDGDGLTDGAEVYTYGTSPLAADTDRDGLADGLEAALGLNPLSPDTDADGLSDMFEVVNGLNPKSSDTDGDGLGDAYEVEYCLSPTNPDTDYDGLPDGIDWNPREHWIVTVVPAALLTTTMLFLVYAFLKYKVYKRS